ncbi:hypothetical protein Cabys_1064 [Caldithrix abyssi DSM 13497]|uniref:Uncharacterized protein n=1 Tax=Caldithrix abyssi DSM 13497 TaxID=880073 RepID=A0A1J1C552_CALAY|nr:hypothetical protein Cabys_1064 [Caldithrix abyssi DSM 13497]
MRQKKSPLKLKQHSRSQKHFRSDLSNHRENNEIAKCVKNV